MDPLPPGRRFRFGAFRLPAILLFAVFAASCAQDDNIYESDNLGGASRINIFPRVGSGDIAPARTITSSVLNGAAGVVVDKVHSEIIVANSGGPSIEIFPSGATGSTTPIRRIIGSSTLLLNPNGVALDPVAGEIYVADPAVQGAIRVYSRTANGDVAPLRTIAGPSTGLNLALWVRIDRAHGEIAVLNFGGSLVSFFPLGSSGDQAPLRVIGAAGAESLELDAVHDEVILSKPSVPAVQVYSRSTGTLLRSITGASTGFVPTCGQLRLHLDAYNNELATTTCGTTAETSVRIFSRTADGDVAPLRSIAGPTTNMTRPAGLTMSRPEVLPQTLLVDPAANPGSNGNGVLEAGETVLVAPSWKNETGASVPLTGTYSSFTGPGASNYNIVDSATDYGTIGAGGISSCQVSHCGAVSVSIPAARPSQHWDATVLETPSTMNLFGVWRIHIGESFSDVPKTLAQYRFVETLFHNGVTSGCGGGIFCPDGPATRGQMAVFLLLSREGTSYSPPPATGTVFNDVPTSDGRAKWVEELYHRGVTAGCGNGNFCPDASVTRAQMAVFLLLTHDGSFYVPPAATGIFTDVPTSSPYAKWVEELYHRGVTAGCGNNNYCPDLAVTRGQMAVFLTTTFSLQLNGL